MSELDVTEGAEHEITPAVASDEPLLVRAVDLARAAGMFPKLFPGPKLRPATENPKAWLYDAAKLRGLSDEDRITQQEFDKRIAEVSTVIVR
jgi:hypothetical protein